MNLGTKIITFDNLPEGENTVGKLEEMFGITLSEKKTALVEIGEPKVGNMRTLFIDDKEIITSLEFISEVGIKPYRMRKQKYGR